MCEFSNHFKMSNYIFCVSVGTDSYIVTCDRPRERILTAENVITAHLKLEKDKSSNCMHLSPNTGLIEEFIILGIRDFLSCGYSVPHMYCDKRKIGITLYDVVLYIDSCRNV